MFEFNSGNSGEQLAKQEQASSAMLAEMNRSIAETQSALIIAQRFPRNIHQAVDEVLEECKEPDFAADAQWIFSRGGEERSGASIRLMEAIARSWRNLDYGWNQISELQTTFPNGKQGKATECKAYAWDMQSNTKRQTTFLVPHWRHTKSGGYELTNDRDIYELCANMAMRRVRACIEGLIPAHIVRRAREECENTLKKSTNEIPLEVRIEKMLAMFSDFGVTRDHIEQWLGKNLDAIEETQILRLKKIYASIRDKISPPEHFFKSMKPEINDPAAILDEAEENQKKPQEEPKENRGEAKNDDE